MNANTIGMLIIMIIYLGVMVLIGVLFSRKNNDTSDFYLGGRKLGPIVTAMSAEASDMSSWLLMGLPGVAYLSGCAEAGWTAIGLAIGTYLNWLIVAKRLRRYSHKANNSITIPSFFANRYRDKSNSLLAISAIMIVIFLRTIHRIRIRSLRQTLCHTLRCSVYACHDRKCHHYRGLYFPGRIPGSKYH